jgi:carboxyl-terminal processing protease
MDEMKQEEKQQEVQAENAAGKAGKENTSKKGTGFWKGVMAGMFGSLAAVAVLAAILSGAFGSVPAGQAPNPENQAEQNGEGGGPGEEEQPGLNRGTVSSKIDMLQYAIEEYFLFDKDWDKIESGIYKGMVAGLEDPYSEYYTKEEYDQITEETEGVYSGIGVLVSQNMLENSITILRVFPGSPAEEAGMQKGDLIYKVGDVMAADVRPDVLVEQHIKGEEGTFVDIVVLRDGEEVPLHVQRRMVEAQTVESKMLEGNTGYILVTQFELNTAQQFKDAVDSLTAQGMERLVIDLRDNPGGVVDSCVEMAAYILPEDKMDGTILTTADKNGEGIRYYCKDGKLNLETPEGSGGGQYPKEEGHQVDVPIAVLVNGNSASASEVFAGALQDYGHAVLVGTTTFGKGIVQSLLPLPDGTAVKLTVSHYYTPGGKDIHGKGLTPDVEVEQVLDEELRGKYDIPPEKDNQLQRAIEELR